jgi:hypothetical protein
MLWDTDWWLANQELILRSELDAINFISRSPVLECERIPEHLLTPVVKAHAISRSIRLVEQMDVVHIGPDVLLAALASEGVMFRNLPRVWMTEELCDAAVALNPGNLKYIPSSKLTEKQVISALRQDFSYIQFVPGELQTQEMWMLCAHAESFTLTDVPAVFRSRRLCASMVARQPLNIRILPRYMLNAEFVRSCLERMPVRGDELWFAQDCMLEYLTDDFKRDNIDFCIEAIRRNPCEFNWIPPGLQTPEMCRVYVEGTEIFDDRYAEVLLPKELVTDLLCRTAIDCGNMNFVRYSVNQDLRRYALTVDPMNMKYIADEHQTVELCNDALRSNPACAEFIDPEILSQLN